MLRKEYRLWTVSYTHLHVIYIVLPHVLSYARSRIIISIVYRCHYIKVSYRYGLKNIGERRAHIHYVGKLSSARIYDGICTVSYTHLGIIELNTMIAASTIINIIILITFERIL